MRRVARQGEGERNFHVFYYLFAGMNQKEKDKYHLGDPIDYHYLRGGAKNTTKEQAIDLELGEMGLLIYSPV